VGGGGGGLTAACFSRTLIRFRASKWRWEPYTAGAIVLMSTRGWPHRPSRYSAARAHTLGATKHAQPENVHVSAFSMRFSNTTEEQQIFHSKAGHAYAPRPGAAVIADTGSHLLGCMSRRWMTRQGIWYRAQAHARSSHSFPCFPRRRPRMRKSSCRMQRGTAARTCRASAPMQLVQNRSSV
jgi:hypothetical protein